MHEKFNKTKSENFHCAMLMKYVKAAEVRNDFRTQRKKPSAPKERLL